MIFSPRASRSRWRWRSCFALQCHRLHSLGQQVGRQQRHGQREHGCYRGYRGGNAIASRRGLETASITRSKHGITSEIKVDHLAHDHHAHEHPSGGSRQHHAAKRLGPKQLDILRVGDVDQKHHPRRQTPDDHRRGLRFHRHRLNFGFHLLAIPQDAGEVAERLRQIAAGLLLNRDDDPGRSSLPAPECVRKSLAPGPHPAADRLTASRRSPGTRCAPARTNRRR